jgi:multicomponent Na+:H+ antiporter subunit B
MDSLIILSLLLMMLVTVGLIIRSRNLFGVIVLGGVYSFLMATALFALDAVDVAMTEASVGAGISTVLMLGALYLCRSEESKPLHRPWLALGISIALAAGLMFGMVGLPVFSDPMAAIHQQVVPRYLNDMPKEIDLPNVVTAVLASYRSYDTLGETTVVFTAGVGVIALLRRRRKGSDDDQ